MAYLRGTNFLLRISPFQCARQKNWKIPRCAPPSDAKACNIFEESQPEIGTKQLDAKRPFDQQKYWTDRRIITESQSQSHPSVLNERTVRQAQEDTQCIFTVVSSTTGL